MKKINQVIGKIKYYFRIVRNILLFGVTAALIVYLFPIERKFKYEFTLGKPWMHPDLQARFDFPIYKTQDELQQEKDSLIKNFKPFFQLKPDIGEEYQEKAEDDFKKNWAIVKEKFTSDLSEFSKADVKQLKDTVKRHYLAMLKEVYMNGVIEPNELYDNNLNDLKYIFVVTGDIAEEKPFENTFTPRDAYEFITLNLKEKISEFAPELSPQKVNVISTLNIGDYIVPNLFYNAGTSNKVKKELLSDISLTKGMVKQGNKIIYYGEIVDNNRYILLSSLRREYATKIEDEKAINFIYFGRALLIFTLFTILYLFLLSFRREILQHTQKTLFILLLIFLVIFSFSMILKNNFVNYYILPVVILPIVIRTFYDGRLALFIHMITIMFLGFFVANSFEFVFLNFVAGIVSILSLTASGRRSKLVGASALIIASYVIMFFAISIIQEVSIKNIEWRNFIWFVINGLLVLIAYPLIYLFEKTFGFVSDATLLELSDTNQPLLRQLAEKAPGTFQHSLQVANLAEEAIRKIGGNVLLVRTGALYHDIGKMNKPYFYTENQIAGDTPHEDLPYEESARIIIEHVTTGIEMAKKHNLPRQIIDFIETHHGDSTVQYFFKMYMNKFPEGKDNVNKFRYPGPKPFSKETAIVMMADSIEAASRSLKEYTEETISELVENIVNYQLMEDQFINADITFKDITEAKAIFKQRLQNIYHARIAYPK